MNTDFWSRIGMKLFTSWEDARDKVNQWKNNKQKVVFTNGCFDLLHPGHLYYLAEARECGDVLIIGLNSDDSVQRLKGKGRPIRPSGERAIMLAGLEMVNAIVPFEQDNPLKLINYLQPDVLVKGGDYEIKDIVGADEVKANGGEVKQLSYKEGFSTTALIEEIKKL